jgi:plastocyanin
MINSFTLATLAPLLAVAAAKSHTVHKVAVGPGLTFDPESLQAEVGDEVEFQFYSGSHSVGQSSFDNPCAPLSDSSFYTGIIDGGSTPAVSERP